MSDYTPHLERIESALARAAEVLAGFVSGNIDASFKTGDDPVTAADLAVDAALADVLGGDDEGWLSEETADDPARLGRTRVWVVDPLDGTREFVAGIPEWCVSVGLVEDGRPVAGGILNPAAGHLIVGAVGCGVTLDGRPVTVTSTDRTEGALVLASRSEVKRGEWQPFFSTPISVRNVGSVAYKLGLVAAGLADATWTLVPKHEWDVAAGAALVVAAGGQVSYPDGSPVRFNQPSPKLPGFVATNGALHQPLLDLIDGTN